MSGRDNGQHEPPNGRGDSAGANDRSARELPSAEALEAQAERQVMNASLDEVLGGKTPPDLAPQILARLSKQVANADANGHTDLKRTTNGAAAPKRTDLNGASESNGHFAVDRALNGTNGSAAEFTNGQSDTMNDSSSGTIHRRAPAVVSQTNRRSLFVAILACSACVLLAFVTYWNWQSMFGGGPHAENSANNSTGENQRRGQDGGDSTNPDGNQHLADDQPIDDESSATGNGAQSEVANNNTPPSTTDRDRNPVIASSGNRNSQPARPVEAIVAGIDAALQIRWHEEGVTPAAWATDAEWCRRVYLDVLGRIPTVEESVNYVTSSDSAKKEQLVNRLLFGSQYEAELADHWATVWTNVLIGREGGTRPESIVSRDGLHQYLDEAFREQRAYDDMVTDLVTATGTNRPEAPAFNGAVNFLLDNMDNNATSATAKTSQIFLAQQIQCAQCHNHPFYEEPQQHFWEMNAFFRQARVVRGRGAAANRRNIARLVDRDFRGEGNRNSDEAEIYYERANGLLEVAFPKFLDGTSIDPSGRLATVNRRQELANMIVNSPWMSQAIVNRMWGYFLGAGFARPLDDLGAHQSVSHPELLDDLASEFSNQDYDLRRLMQWIVLSKPYALSSQLGTQDQSADQPFAAGGPLFSRFYSRQLSPEAVYDSLLVAAGGHNETPQEAERRRRLWLGQFTIELQNDENREVNLFDGAIPQTLEMWNGKLTSRALSLQDQGLLASIANSEMSDADKIKHLFLSALSREPTAAETRVVRGMIREAGKGGLPQVLQDVYWALLNSSEFILQH